MSDVYFNPGSRLRISANDGPFWLWIRWGWRAEWQLGVTKNLRRPLLLRTPGGFRA